MQVTLSKLPKDIQKQIPMSIRSASNTYNLDELPAKEQELIREYLTPGVVVTYKKAFDCTPNISKYADFATTNTVKETIVEYLTNYFYTIPGSYPFDPVFGCRLKYHLQTKDTQLRKLLISDEINQVVNALSSDLSVPIIVNSISIVPIPTTLETSYSVVVEISVPGEENVAITVKSFNND